MQSASPDGSTRHLPLSLRLVVLYWRSGLIKGRERLAQFVCSRLDGTRDVRTTVDPGGFEVLLDPRDPISLFPLTYGMMPGERFNALWYLFIRPGDTVLDVGANFGYYTLHAAAAAGESGRVIALEPQPAIARRARTNAALNSFGNVTVINAAAGDIDGEISLHCPTGRQSGIATCRGDSDWLQAEMYRTIPVPCHRLDTLIDDMDLQPVAAVKIDVEGFECEVISGLRETLRSGDPPVLFMESPVQSEECTGAADDLLNQLSGAGYTVYRVEAEAITAVEGSSELQEHDDLIALNADATPRFWDCDLACGAEQMS